jgi:hypothetical protein
MSDTNPVGPGPRTDTRTGTLLETLVEPEIDLDAPPPDPDDHEPVSHVVRQSELAEALVSGGTVVALCGRRFSPKLINPDLDPCQACLQIAASGAY